MGHLPPSIVRVTTEIVTQKFYQSCEATENFQIFLMNFRFSPCIIIVNHFYYPTNVLIVQNVEVKIYIVEKFKRYKIKNHSDMFRIICDPTSGSTELRLTGITHGDSQIFCRVLGRCLAA